LNDKPENNILPSEWVTRYILQRGHYAPTRGRVKHHVFLPPPNGEISVYRITDLTVDQIWDIGERHVAQPRGKTLRARADLIASDVFENSLELVPETNIHPLHASIVGWPDVESECLLIAIKLAKKAWLRLKPS